MSPFTRGQRRRLLPLAVALGALALGGCKAAGGVDDDGDSDPPPGGSGTGAGGVPVFWKVLGFGTAYGALNEVRQTSDGGVVGAGFQDADVYVVKLDRLGAVAWERRIPFAGGAHGEGIDELAGGGFVVAGGADLEGGEVPFLLRLGPDGATLPGWPRTYGSPGDGTAKAVVALGGGADGFVAAGYRYEGQPRRHLIHVFRTSAAGEVLWSRSDYPTWCPGGGAFASALAPTGDGDVVVAGATGCGGWSSVLLRIASADGAEAWRRAYDMAEATVEMATAVARAPDGGYYVAGWRAPRVEGGAAPGDAVVLKTDAAGNESWRAIHAAAEAESFEAITATTDGGFVAVGRTRSYGGPVADPANAYQWDDLLLARGTAAGEIAWRKVKGLRPPWSDGAFAVFATSDGGFVVGGGCRGNVLFAKFDANGGTVSLGAEEIAYTIPSSEGAIRSDTAVAAAAAGAIGLTRPRLVGGTVLDLLVAALRGEAASEYCTSGGSYAFTPVPPVPVVAPQVLAFAFEQCASGPASDPAVLDGTASVRITSAAGDPRTASYALAATVEELAIDVPAAQETTTISGSLRIERTSTGAGVAEVARSVASPAPAVLRWTIAEAGLPTTAVDVGPFALSDTVSPSGELSCGAAGEVASVDAGTGPLEVTVLAPLRFGNTDPSPASGAFAVAAPDGSRVTVTVVPSGAALEVDSDGDGVADGTLSVPWDALD